MMNFKLTRHSFRRQSHRTTPTGISCGRMCLSSGAVLPSCRLSHSWGGPVVWMVGVTLFSAIAAAQNPSPAPLPPELPYLISEEDANSSPVASRTPAHHDQLSLNRGDPQGKVNQQPTTPILRSIDAHIREVEAAEARRLHQLKMNIMQFRAVLDQQRKRTEEERLKAEDAERRERDAMRQAKESQELMVEARQREAEARQACQPIADQNPTNPNQSTTQENGSGSSTIPDPAVAEPNENSDRSPAINLDAPMPTQEFKPTPPPKMVVNSAVDQRALADNLFGAGEYKLAREIYEIMLGNDESGPDATWFRYQVANCHRQLGNEQRAATYYRVVAADDNDAFLSENSKWWLAILEKKTGFDSRIADLTQVMEQIRQTIR